MTKKTKGLKSRILTLSILAAMVPLSVSTWRVLTDAEYIKEDITHSFGEYALEIMDVVERNLFERYGDVQAFSSNEITLNREIWGERHEERNGIIRAMNKYMDLYDIYSVMIAVDLEGNTIAANTRDANGKAVDNNWIFEKNFKNSNWFQDAISGNFLKGDGTDGTVVEDIHADPIVRQLRGDESYAIGFTAPILDRDGKTIGVWTNRVSFDLVEHILEAAYDNLKMGGYETTELTLLDKQGRVIVDLDPHYNQGVVAASHDPEVILKMNLADAGVEAAVKAVKGEHGAMLSDHARKGISQVTGYVHSHGALGYKGLGWSLLVRIDESEAMGSFKQLNIELAVIFILSLVGTSYISWRLARKICDPIQRISNSLSENADQTRSSAQIVDKNSQSLAEGATEQAANVEETSASSEELNAMTAQTTDNVAVALKQVRTVSSVVHSSNDQLRSLISAMKEISMASDETKNIIKTIDEIAFQTNILALNAAVEAARAGEAGAGFAIVADEVRNLAERAANAAQNTSGLIDQNIEKIKRGSETVEQTNQGFKKLLEATDSVTNIMEEIDGASRQQSVGLTQINTAVTEISEVTQRNAAGAEEVASASRELSDGAYKTTVIARELAQLVTGSDEIETSTDYKSAPKAGEELDWGNSKSNRIKENEELIFN